jgi:hypothetical protein
MNFRLGEICRGPANKFLENHEIKEVILYIQGPCKIMEQYEYHPKCVKTTEGKSLEGLQLELFNFS